MAYLEQIRYNKHEKKENNSINAIISASCKEGRNYKPKNDKILIQTVYSTF